MIQKQWSLGEWISNFLRDGEKYYDDYEDDDLLPHQDAMPGGDEDGMYDDFIDDGVVETVLIMVLAAALVWLIYYRQAAQLAHRRREEDRLRAAGQPVPLAPEPGEGGFFPPPGDPAFPGWVAGGVGH